MSMNINPDPHKQSEVQRRRNATTIRIARIRNGYLVTEGDTGEANAALSREDMHRQVDEFFDRIEREEAEGDEHLEDQAQPPDVDHRAVSPVTTQRPVRAITREGFGSFGRPIRGVRA